MDSCLYYQAHLEKKECWFFVAILRSFEYLAFDRTIDKETSLFEIYVTPSQKEVFEEIMEYFQKNGVVLDFKQINNRLLIEDL